LFLGKRGFFIFFILLAGCAEFRPPLSSPPPTVQTLNLTPVSYDGLLGWQQDEYTQAFATFLRSCSKIIKQPARGQMIPGFAVGKTIDLQRVCHKALQANIENSSPKVRLFFETWFKLYQVSDGTNKHGLFTGYYEPRLRGSRKRSSKYNVALYRRPPDLVSVGLGRFRKGWLGQEISGQLSGVRLVPYASRAAIDRGALKGRGLELLWVDNAIDAFFLHIQGSGRIVLDTGETVRVGFAGRNGQPYFAIGRDLVKKGIISIDNISLQSIRAWLEKNPNQAVSLMQKNKSYIFFREVKVPQEQAQSNNGPLGAAGVSLTPGRSLAVDRKYFSMGTPMWIDTSHPLTQDPLRRLMVAQDTGGAIVGPVRGDFFGGRAFRLGKLQGG
jgi:membrane-bound lytic murein transglycosylase A